MATNETPWNETMPDELFSLMADVLDAPSPIGFEAAMTFGVLKPHLERLALDGWAFHQFRGNAGLVLDTHPGRDDMLSVMLIGHADKIRMQVRSIGEDGKIWIDTDSFLPGVLIGHEVQLFSQAPDSPGSWRTIEGGTIEALGAIHFAPAEMRSGAKGIKKEQIYLDLQIHGEKKREQVANLGIRPGDPIIFKRRIRRGFSPDTFYGAYLDNGLGCFVTAEIARLVAERGGLENVRLLFTFATHEEIGRMGSRVAAGVFRPDVIIGLDVAHDFEAAPGVSDRRFFPIKMGGGFTLTSGSIVNEAINTRIERAAREYNIPMQKRSAGRDTGTDAMAGFFAAVDAASTSVGFPIRNMHTISETGHTGDVLAAIWAMYRAVEGMDRDKLTADDLKNDHARLDRLEPATPWRPEPDDS